MNGVDRLAAGLPARSATDWYVIVADQTPVGK